MAETTGLLFPLVLTSGRHTLVSGSDLIQASIKTIITWALYTRFFNGEFGCRVNEVLEEPNDNILLKLTRKFIIDAISRWEKRVELQEMNFYRPSSDKLVVELTYFIRELNTSETFSQTIYTN